MYFLHFKFMKEFIISKLTKFCYNIVMYLRNMFSITDIYVIKQIFMFF